MKTIETKNKEWGFYGTTVTNRKFDIAAEWPAAFEWVHVAVPVWTAVTVRDFLDSTCGRHLADEAYAANGIANVDPERWMRSFLDFAEDVGKEDSLEGLRERIQAARAIKKAKEQMRDAAGRLAHLLEALPEKGKENVMQQNFRSYADRQLEMIRAYLGDEG